MCRFHNGCLLVFQEYYYKNKRDDKEFYCDLSKQRYLIASAICVDLIFS